MSWYNDFFKKSLKSDIEEMLKADGVTQRGVAAPVPTQYGNFTADILPDQAEDNDSSKQVGRKSIISDPYFDNMGGQTLIKQKLSRLSPRVLKEVSVRDFLVSAIIQTRVDTLLRFSRPEHRRFEMGFRVIKKDAQADHSKDELHEIAAIEDFIYHCGRKEGTPAEDRMLFGEWLKLIVRDALTFGHVAVEKVKTRSGGLHRFRPLPAESVYIIDKRVSKEQIEGNIKISEQMYRKPLSNNDPAAERHVNEVPIDYYKYVQMSYNMQPLVHFGDEDMIFKNFNVQNFVDLNGYSYSPLELAIITVTNHLNVENYNCNFFTHGYAARGVLHLKGTVTQAQLMNFRRQFYNSISGQQHAWRTPIVAGLDEVQWVPMSASAKEMEYINFNNHLMRIICMQFAIDPMELGLDYLISGNGRAPSQQANNEYKIAYSRERGLYPILMFIEDMMNSEIIPAIDKGFGEKYKFVFTGYTDETPQTEVAQMQAEQTVWKTMNDLLVQSQKPKINSPAADLPMNQAFWHLIESNYTRGEIREQFFGDKGASKRRELQYIPGDASFMAWAQTLLAIDQAKEQKVQAAAGPSPEQQQQQQQLLLQQQQHEHAEAGHKRDEDKHGMELEQLKAQAAAGAVHHGINPLEEAARQFGATKATNVEGVPMKNPIGHISD